MAEWDEKRKDAWHAKMTHPRRPQQQKRGKTVAAVLLCLTQDMWFVSLAERPEFEQDWQAELWIHLTLPARIVDVSSSEEGCPGSIVNAFQV